MIQRFVLAAALTLAAGSAMADPIEGHWKTPGGDVTAISACGGSYCITGTGQHSGVSVGKMTAADAGQYEGTITNPRNGKTYNGTAVVAGNSLKLSGCMLGGLLCESQTWTKQ